MWRSAALLVACAGLAASHNPHDIISGLHTSEDGSLVLAISRGLLFRSEDGGNNFMLSHHGLPNPLSQHAPMSFAGTPIASSADKDGTLFLLDTSGFFYKSTDVGRNWVTMPALPKTEEAVISQHKGETLAQRVAVSTSFSENQIVLIAGKTLLRSTDGGETFETVLKGKVGTEKMRTLLATTSAMYAATSLGALYMSTDEGRTWALVGSHGDTDITSVVETSADSLLLASKAGVVNMVINKGKGTATKLLGKEKLAARDGFMGEVAATVLPSGVMLTSQDANLLRSEDHGNKWEQIDGDYGLHTALMQSDAEGVPSFMRFAVASKAGRVFAGLYTGVYRSDDAGESWIKIDTIAPYITHLQVGAGRSAKAAFTVAVCTYTAGCFQGEVGVEGGTPRMLSDGDMGDMGDASSSLPTLARLQIPTKASKMMKTTQRYLAIVYSPNLATDGIVMVSSATAGLQRSEDAAKTWKNIALPVQKESLDETVHSIAFSPSFADDDTVFVSGFNIGVARSSDKGKTFKALELTVNGVEQKFTVFGTYCKLAMGTNFRYGESGKQQVVAHYRSDQDQGSNKGASRAWEVGYNTSAHLAMTSDGGSHWRVVGSQSNWRDVSVISEADGTNTIWAMKSTATDTSGAKFDLELNVENKDGSGFRKVKMDAEGNFGPNGFSRAVHGDHLVASYLDGGIVTGKANSESMALDEMISSMPTKQSKPGDFPWFAQTLLPQDDSLRGMGRLVMHSPNFAKDGTIFGAHAFGVMVSTDKGASWSSLARIWHSTSKVGQYLKHCKLAKNSDTPVLTHPANSAHTVFNDDGAYCLECEEGHKRNAGTGACQGGEADTIEAVGVEEGDIFGEHDYVETAKKANEGEARDGEADKRKEDKEDKEEGKKAVTGEETKEAKKESEDEKKTEAKGEKGDAPKNEISKKDAAQAKADSKAESALNLLEGTVSAQQATRPNSDLAIVFGIALVTVGALFFASRRRAAAAELASVRQIPSYGAVPHVDTA